MKKIIFLIYALAFSLNIVYAVEYDTFFSHSSNEELSIGDEFYVRYDFSMDIIDVNFTLTYDEELYKITKIETCEDQTYEFDYETNELNTTFVIDESYPKEPYVSIYFEVIQTNSVGTDSVSISSISLNDGTSEYTDEDDEVWFLLEKLPSSDSSLLSLFSSIGEMDKDFSTEITDYTLYLDSSVNEITIYTVLNDVTATIQGDTGLLQVSDKDVLKINVTAEDGSNTEYTIIISQESDNYVASSNLSKLYLNYGYMNFDKNTYTYDLKVSNNVTSIILNYSLEDELALVEVEKEPTLDVGDNVIKIIVTGTDNVVKTYTINIYRCDEDDYSYLYIPDDEDYYQDNDNLKDNYLTDLYIEGYSLEFDKEVTYYEIVYNDFDSLQLYYEQSDDYSIVEIFGNENLEVGSTINIVVTAINGENKIYDINIIEDANYEDLESNIESEESSYFLSNILIISVGIGLIILIVVFSFYFYNKIFKNKKQH